MSVSPGSPVWRFNIGRSYRLGFILIFAHGLCAGVLAWAELYSALKIGLFFPVLISATWLVYAWRHARTPFSPHQLIFHNDQWLWIKPETGQSLTLVLKSCQSTPLGLAITWQLAQPGPEDCQPRLRRAKTLLMVVGPDQLPEREYRWFTVLMLHAGAARASELR